jgi:hypothetical protein
MIARLDFSGVESSRVCRLVVLPVAVAALILVGCAPAETVQSPTSPATIQDIALPPIEIIRTGGFAGVHQALSIDSAGAWSGPAGSGRLSDAAQAQLAQIVADPDLPGEAAAATTGQCCDMFEYELRVGGQTYAFGEPDLGPLLIELLGLLREETGF